MIYSESVKPIRFLKSSHYHLEIENVPLEIPHIHLEIENVPLEIPDIHLEIAKEL